MNEFCFSVFWNEMKLFHVGCVCVWDENEHQLVFFLSKKGDACAKFSSTIKKDSDSTKHVVCVWCVSNINSLCCCCFCFCCASSNVFVFLFRRMLYGNKGSSRSTLRRRYKSLFKLLLGPPLEKKNAQIPYYISLCTHKYRKFINNIRYDTEI